MPASSSSVEGSAAPRRLSPGPARRARRTAGRAGGADGGLDLPLGRSRRPAARRPHPDPDEHVRRRAVPAAPGRRPAAGLGRERQHQGRLERGAAGGDPPAGRLGAHVRPAAGGDLPRARSPSCSRRRISAAWLGGCFLPSDGQLDPSQLTSALAAGARAGGVRIFTRTRVLAIDTLEDRHGRRVRRVRTDRGDVECEVVVDCGGMYAAEIARLAGVRLPIVPMSHQYVVTEAMPAVVEAARGGPAAAQPPRPRPARLLPAGGRRPGHRRLRARPGAVHRDERRYDAIPADFNGRLLPDDWDRLEEISANAQRRVPAHRRGRDPAGGQRAGGLHAGQRVLPG